MQTKKRRRGENLSHKDEAKRWWKENSDRRGKEVMDAKNKNGMKSEMVK